MKIEFKIENVQKAIENLKYNEKLIYLVNIKNDFLQSQESNAYLINPFRNDFARKCEVEIKRIEEIEKINNPISKSNQSSLNDIAPIKWNNDIKELSYIFWKLRKEKIIVSENLGLTLSKIFKDNKSDSIKNTMFNKYLSDFDGNDFPKKAAPIDNFIQSIKD